MTLRNYTSLLAVMMLVCTLFNASAQCTPPPCGGRTQTQGGWGTNPNGNNPGTILQANFASAFPTGITIGCTNTLKLTTAAAVRNFLPQGSTPKALPAGVSINPTSTFKNVFAGQVVALTISLKFDATVAGFNTSGTPLKDQYVVSGLFAGWTVQQVYDEAVKKLGGCASPYTFAQLNDAISSINENYVDGTQNNGFLVCAPRVCCVSTDAVCFGSATGSVTVTAHGAAPISYAWSNGAISQNLVNVTAGIYTVTITDGIGLTSSTSCEVGQDQPLTATASSAGVSCYQACDGIVSINISGGAAPYVTQWSPSISNINNVCAGSYSYTVTDAHGCTVGGSVVVNEPAQLNVSASAMSPLCYGLTGSASASAGGGAMPYSYVWSNGATGASISGLVAGTYGVTVTDENGCTASDAVVITVPSPVVAVASSSNVSCYGACDGTASVTSGGGTGSLSILWSNGSTDASVNGLCADDYSVVVTDENGCTASENVTIHQPAEFVIDNISVISLACANDDNGSIEVSVSGGTSPYSIAWDNGDEGFLREGLAAGSYCFTVTDANGCTAGDCATITEPDQLLAYSSCPDAILCHNSCTGSIDVTVLGGVEPYTFIWSNGATTEDISGLCPDAYGVTITDANGCVFELLHAPFENPEQLVLLVSEVIEPTVCMNACNGSISVDPIGGTAPYTFEWNDGDANQTRDGLCAGSYSVTVTDANGCTATTAPELIELSCPCPEILISATAQNDSNCGDNICDGTISIEVLGGYQPYSYAWSNGSTEQNLTGVCDGSYSVIVTDAYGCTVSYSDSIDCITDCPLLRTQTQGGWGTNPNGNNPGVYNHANFASAFPAGLTIGCTNTLTLTSAQAITDFLPSGSTPSALPAGALLNPGGSYSNVLAGQLVALTLSVTYDYYDVNFAAGDDNLGDRVVASGLFEGKTVNEVLAIANNVIGGCSNGYTFSQVNQVLSSINENYVDGTVDNGFLTCNPCDLEASVSSSNVNCFDACDGAASVSVSTGAASYEVIWNDGVTGESRSNLCAGTYGYTVTDANGCADSGVVVISQPELLYALIDQADVTCAEACDGAAMLGIYGGTAPFSVIWSNGQFGGEIMNLCKATYSYTVTDANGCSYVGEVTIGGPETLTLTVIEATDPTVCANACNGIISLEVDGGTEPFVISWNDGGAGLSRNDLCGGEYAATVTDANGCSAVVDPNPIVLFCITQCDTLRTQTQGGWGSTPNGNNPGVYLHNNFAAAFPSGLTIGCSNTLTLNDAQAVTDFIPSGSTASALPAGSLINPGQSYSNVFAGQLVAATLSVTFDYYDANFGGGSDNLGDRYLASGDFAGWTVSEVIAEANAKIGGCASAYSFSQLNDALATINENYVDGTTDEGNLSCTPVSVAVRHEASALNNGTAVNAFPNPFAITANIEFSVATDDNVTLDVYNVTGVKVAKLFSGNVKAGSAYSVSLDGSDLAQGMYVYRLVTSGGVQTGYILRVK